MLDDVIILRIIDVWIMKKEYANGVAKNISPSQKSKNFVLGVVLPVLATEISGKMNTTRN